MKIREIKDINPNQFIEQKIREIHSFVGEELAINTLSGGVDSAVVTMLGHRALGERLKTFFIDTGLMRKNESNQVVSTFKELGITVQVIQAQERIFSALKDLMDPEEKRAAINHIFSREIFGKLIRESGAKFLLRGTNYTDVEEIVAGLKRQQKVLEQLGVDTHEVYDYKVIEPLIQIRKPLIRKICRTLGMPAAIHSRPPFPAPGLAARILGEITPEKVELVREANAIVEKLLSSTGAYQYMAILHSDWVTGIKKGKRYPGWQIEIRCWESKDVLTGSPFKLNHALLLELSDTITSEVPGVVSVVYNITRKPPLTIEAV
jgi:GMP synthase (glutamine-hydrolysing)